MRGLSSSWWRLKWGGLSPISLRCSRQLARHAESRPHLFGRGHSMGMSFELMMLAAASLWGFLQLVAAAQAANAQYGLKWAASPRDFEMAPLKPIAGRIDRNFRNYMETFPYF